MCLYDVIQYPLPFAINTEHIVTLSYHVPGQHFVPLHLKACSANCQQKLVAHSIEKYTTELERKMSDRIVLSISALAFSCDQNKSIVNMFNLLIM